MKPSFFALAVFCCACASVSATAGGQPLPAPLDAEPTTEETPTQAVSLSPAVTTLSLAGRWQYRAGDEPRFDDTTVTVPGMWPADWASSSKDGFVWLRTVVAVPWLADGDADLGRFFDDAHVAVAVFHAGNAFEVFSNGVSLGKTGELGSNSKLLAPAPLVVTVPASAVKGGLLEITLRVWRSTALNTLNANYAGKSGVAEVFIGRRDVLQNLVDVRRLEDERRQAPFGPLALVLIMAGLYHLQLFRRRRALREYLWLGLLLVLLAVICTLHTWWWDFVTDDMGLRIKLSMVGGFFTAVLFVQFLWPFLGKAITRFWRGYQIVQLVFAGVTLVVPGVGFLVASAPLRSLSWLPWLVMSVVLVVSQAVKKNPEARTLTAGLLAFIACGLYAALQSIGLVPVGELDSVMMWVVVGVCAFVLSMALSLSNRFVRVYNSLDVLNTDLAQKNHVLTSMNTASSRFVPREFLKIIGRDNLVEVQRGDHVQREMSVMFSDIRSFTTIVEGLTPEQNFRFINGYLGTMEGPIRKEGGFIDSYIGDAIMALFDAGANAAVRAGIGDLRALEEHNAERVAAGDKPLRIGIGVSTGSLMLGTIGGKDRINCGVIGDCVNLAARVESMTKMYGASFLISEFTHARLADPSVYALRVVDRVRAKGKTKPVTIYEVLDGLPAAERSKRIASRPTFEAGWRAFQDGDVTAALGEFRAVVAADADDEAARLWVARCEALEQTGLPADFDGVVELKSK